MKIEWLNEHMSEAIVTRGWFRKRRAHVRRGGYAWQFVATGRPVSRWVDHRLDAAFSREIKRQADAEHADREWVSVELPQARLVERKL